MNQNAFNPLNVNSWPIWLRITFAFLIATLIPMAIVLTLIQQQVANVDLRNLEAFLSDTGGHRQENIQDVFDSASQDLTYLTASSEYQPQLLNLLTLAGRSSTLTNSVNSYIDQRMLDTGLFSQVTLVTLGDIVRLSNPAGTADAQNQLRGAPILQVAETAFELGEQQRTIAYTDRDGDLVIAMMRFVYDGDNDATGYAVGFLNYEDRILEVLLEETEFIAQPRRYLATVSGEVLAQPSVASEVAPFIDQTPVQSAFNGESDVTLYEIDGTEYIGHYAPIGDVLALVTELPVDTSFSLTASEIYGDGVFVIILSVIFALVIAGVTAFSISNPLRILEADIRALNDGDFDRPVDTISRGDEIGLVAQTFVNTREQIRSLLEDLEARIQASVRDVEATQEVSRFAANQRDLQILMDKVVDLIVNRFANIYHAQIFLMDDAGKVALLRASTGEAGRQLLARGHRLEVGSISVIGQVTEEARVIVARDTEASGVHRRNEFLQTTRAELAIPLRIGRKVIGALDVQSQQSDSFDRDQINTLQTMADQIAIAIENARLYQESVQRLQEVADSNRQLTQTAWQEYMAHRRQQQLVSEAGAMTEVDMASLRQLAVERDAPVVGEVTADDTIPFAVPIRLRGQVLGAAEWEIAVTDFAEGKVQLAQELVNRLALSLDNARLFQESRRAIDRERLVNEVAAKLTSQTDIDDILQIAVREVGQALRAPNVNIRLRVADDASHSNGSNGQPKNGNSEE